MRHSIIKTLAAFALAITLSACGDDAAEKKATGMLRQARTQFDNGQYDAALGTIDSLRKQCPDAIEARKTALRLYQEVELKRTQLKVETADKALAVARDKYAEMKKAVDAIRGTSGLTKEKLSSLTRMKLKVDSLQAVFDGECAKIRYIRKKMDE